MLSKWKKDKLYFRIFGTGKTLMKLHEAIDEILSEFGRVMTTKEIADEVNRRRNYVKRNGTDVTDYQIHGRTKNYPHIFTRKGSYVGLVKWGNIENFVPNILPKKKRTLSRFNKKSENFGDSDFKNLEREDLEEIRDKYRPKTISILFIGESPPAGGTFFYLANSNLFRYTYEAFRLEFKQMIGDEIEFLNFFKQNGCFLDDLCLEPTKDKSNAGIILQTDSRLRVAQKKRHW